MRFADDGQLLVWVHMPSRLQDGEWTETQAFDVFDPEGALRGRVVFPDSTPRLVGVITIICSKSL